MIDAQTTAAIAVILMSKTTETATSAAATAAAGFEDAFWFVFVGCFAVGG